MITALPGDRLKWIPMTEKGASLWRRSPSANRLNSNVLRVLPPLPMERLRSSPESCGSGPWARYS